MNEIFANVHVWEIVKILVLVGEGIYVLFSLVVVRQVQLMVSTLDGTLTSMLKLIAWLQLLGAIALFVFSLVLL